MRSKINDKINKVAKLTLLGLSVGSLLIGCTKELPYDKQDNDKTKLIQPEEKASLPKEVDSYLYVASGINSSRTTDATFPQYMGESKIVRFQVHENHIEIIEPDKEERFADNPVNSKSVMTIPIRHVDYHCALDADGKCTNKEEEDENKPWRQRRFFKIEPDRLEKQEVSQMPLEIKNLFYSCYDEVGSKFAGMTLEKDSVLIQVEKSYRRKLSAGGDENEKLPTGDLNNSLVNQLPSSKKVSQNPCGGRIGQLSDLNFKVKYVYSFVKLSSIASPDYKPLYYNRAEENKFGFFDNDTLKLGADNIGRVKNEVKYLHRWNPNKKVVYRLTENFNKPEYKLIKKATVEAVENINRSLEIAGTEMRIELQEATPNMNTGDIRVSTIAMVEDPVNYGILGYGPTAYNPETGEIVQARAAMYIGVMKKGIERAYQEVLEEKLSKMSLTNTNNASSTNGPGVEVVFNLDNSHAKLDLIQNSALSTPLKSSPTSRTSNTKDSFVQSQWSKKGLKLNTLLEPLHGVILSNDQNAVQKLIASTHCFFGEDDLNIHDLLEGEILKIVEEIGPKPWPTLSEAEQQRIISVLLPFVWTPTLIHEIGHTLGLRHNFAGSEDKKNFYTPEEIEKLGMKRAFNYSSVMDYGYRNTNELRVLGKYDIAALRYGYAEKVEVEVEDESGGKKVEIISLDEFRANKNSQLKDYDFCTDEHVSVNPNCNRFDEGTTLTEIAQHWMTMYEQNYLRRSFRNGLSDFSSYDEPLQVSRLALVFDSLRSIFERYEGIKYTYGRNISDADWEEDTFLKELKTAALMAGQFFVNVLRTPDVLCAVAEAAKPNAIVAVLPIRMLSVSAIDCGSDEIRMNPRFVIVGQAGKSFQNRKDRANNDNPYIDQIDVRGIWLDKVMALEALTGRITGTSIYDEFTTNYLDMPEAKDVVIGVMSQIILDEVVSEFPIFTASGQVVPVTIPVSFYSDELGERSHKIQVPLNPSVQNAFGVPSSGIDFQMKTVQTLKRLLPSPAQTLEPDSLFNGLQVVTTMPDPKKAKDYLTTKAGIQTLYVHNQSTLAKQVLAYKELTENLSGLSEEKLEKVLEILECQKQPDCQRSLPKDANKAEKFAYSIAGEEGIKRFLDGGFHSSEYYARLLLEMVSK